MKTKNKSLFAWFGRTVAVSLVPLMLVACATDSSNNNKDSVVNQDPPAFSTDPSSGNTITGTSVIKIAFNESVTGIANGTNVVLKYDNGTTTTMDYTAPTSGNTYTFDPNPDLASGNYQLEIGYGTSIVDSDGQAATPATVVFTVSDARTTARLALESGGLSPSVVTAADNAAALVTNDLLSVIPAAMSAGIAAAPSADKATVISSLMATLKGVSSLTQNPGRNITRIVDTANFNLLLALISDQLTALAVAGTLTSAELQAAVSAVNTSLTSAGADADEVAGYETTFNNAITADINASTLTADYATAVATAVASSPSAATATGQTYTLTTSQDSISGTTAADSIVATDSTLTNFDTIDGAAGTDTLTFTNIGNNGYGGFATAVVSNVENLIVKSASGAIPIDASGWTGLSSVIVQQTGTKAAITMTTKAPTVTISGGTTVDIYDNQTTDTLTSVSLSGNSGNAAIASGALTSLTVADTTAGADAVVTAAAGTRALSVNLDTVTGGSLIADNETTALTVTVSGGAASAIELHAKNAATVAIAASDNLTISDLNFAQSNSSKTSLTITGSAPLVSITDTTPTDDNLTSINLSGASGTVDISAFTLNTDTAFTGSAGVDYIKIGATTAAIDLGAGNDNLSLTLSSADNLTTGSIDGGAGDDTLNLNADNASNGRLTDNMSNFEYLVVTDDTDNYTIDLANLGNINHVTFNGTGLVANAKTIDNLTSGGTLRFIADQADNTTITVAGAATGTADVLNLVVSSSSGLTLGNDSANFVRVQNVETINITTDDTATTPTGIQHTLSLVADNMTALNVSGDAGIDLDNLTGSISFTSKLTAINTSGVTNGTVKITTQANDNVTFIGGDNTTVISMAAITSSGNTSSITTGAGADNITGGAGVDTINSGAGNDNITAGGGADVITGGAGNDWIYGGGGADTMTGGADNDTFYFGAVTDSTSSAADTITDFGTYDVIDLSAFTTDNGSYTGTITGSLVVWASNGASEAKMDSTGAVYVDVDGNGSLTSADIVFTITGAPTLDNATNFRF